MLSRIGAVVRRLAPSEDGRIQTLLPEATPTDIALIERVRPFTMTSHERLWGLLQAVRYVHAHGIEGDFVECGVWKGGSSMLAALAFQELNDHRKLWLYDTFKGMPRPADIDISPYYTALVRFSETQDGEYSDWCRASLDEVRSNMASTGHPHIAYVEGRVEETLLTCRPESIAVLRLDTDWYQSTKIEMEQLYPGLSPGGVLILDDYGWWSGSRKAIDDYFADKPRPLFKRLDESGRLIIKPSIR